MNFTNDQLLPFPRQEVFDWHMRPGAFERLAPPFQAIESDPRTPPVAEGSRNRFLLKQQVAGLTLAKIPWLSMHEDIIEGERFVDRQIEGPFASWRHEHCFLDGDLPDHTRLLDRVDWTGPLWGWLTPLARWFVEGTLRSNFGFREQRLMHDLERHQTHAERPRLRIGITGASGMIGRALSAFLTTGGHKVVRLVRQPPGADDELFWNPVTGAIDRDKLSLLDAVVHLAGENLAGGRWSRSFKTRVISSRVRGTELISRTLADIDPLPSGSRRTLISTSAIGYYGDTGDELVDERSDSGANFMAEVCRAWERATRPAQLSDRVSTHIARIGVVLSPRGGALPKLLAPTRLGVGGPIGGGRQYLSWVALDDVLGAFHEILMKPETAPELINLVAPNPVPQRQLARTLGKVLRRPAVVPVPAPAVKLLFGQMGVEAILQGQNAVPAALQAWGYRFAFEELEELLRFELGRPVVPPSSTPATGAVSPLTD